MNDIKIFIANRHDQNYEKIENPLFHYVTCGSIYDNTNTTSFNDCDGDNISKKHLLFRSITVQYWAWKNCNADYFGFFQYRRFLSFTTKHYEYNEYNYIAQQYIDAKTSSKYQLLNEEKISDYIKEYDIITSEPMCTKKLGIKTVKEYCEKREAIYSTTNYLFIEELLSLKYPQYLPAYHSYMNDNKRYLYNIFIMKNELFQKYSEWLFDILFELEKKIDFTNYSYQQLKIFATLSEDLFGIFFKQLEQEKKYKIQQLQLVEFKKQLPDEEINPKFEENNIALVLSSSDYYVPYLTTMIKSIILHSSVQNNYDIVVLESEITEINKSIIKEMCKDYNNISIRFYNVVRKMQGLNLKAGGHISVETYYRLLIPEIFINYTKVLFLDSDMTAHYDVAELYKEDVSDYMVAATYDQCIAAFYNGSDKSFMPYCKSVLKLSDPYSYFQAGVMVMNLERFRKKYTTQEILEFASSRQFTYVDQDILNSLCRNEVKHIDLSWNVFPDFGDYKTTYMPNFLYEAYKKARKNPKICHHTGPIKPWANPNADIFMEKMFWSIARETPFYEIMLYRMSSEVSHYITYHVKNNKFKKHIKKMLKKIATIFLPINSKRRKIVKKIYYKLRGWDLPTWDLV